ncbi:MAG: hypothetical protein QXW18_04900 [Candidatus Bathyarchaeia archaeon]
MELKYIIEMAFKNRRGMLQALNYQKKAKQFWREKRAQLIGELYQLLLSSSGESLSDLTRSFANRIGFPELCCDKDEIRRFRETSNMYGVKELIENLIDFGARTKLVSMLIAPALAQAEGIGIDAKNTNKCIYSVGLCHPISADMSDCILDDDIPKHPIIPYENWVIAYKIGAASIFYIGQKHAQTLGDRIMERLEKGLDVVSEAQRLDLEAKKSSYVPLSVIEKIYDGKIGEIEATIFSCIDILGGSRHPQFERGSLYLANEVQIEDDNQELLGEGGHEKPGIPNPSFFLNFCRDRWKRGERDLEDIMRGAAIDSYRKGEEYHAKVKEECEKLGSTFHTKPFFEVTILYMHKLLVESHNRFLKGTTYPILKPQLAKLIAF